jgi:hypothetical protein
MAQLPDQEILSILQSEVTDSAGYLDSEISSQREKAIEYFYGEPFGNEEDGRSQVVITDVQDTLMWMMPSLMRIFTAGDKLVKFLPVSAEDEAVADQATKYVNHVFYKQNNGFSILYNFFLDALLLKVGVVKHYWEETEDTTTEEYENLTQGEFDLLTNDKELDLQQHTETTRTEQTNDPMTGEVINVEIPNHDAVFVRTKIGGKVTVENVPPEEFLINKGAKTVEDARFICHRSRKSRSDLINMGFDAKDVEDLPAYSGAADTTTTNAVYMARHSYDATDVSPSQSAYTSEEQVEIFETYIRCDMYDDGVSTLRKIIYGGDIILDNEAVDTIPFSTICPIPIPHKFFGLSIAETVQDVQLVRSTLTRNLLDNMYLANNGRFQVVEGQVNIDDLLTNRPGGIVRTRSPQALQPIQTPALQDYSFKMLEYWDEIKAGRTGVNPSTQGLPADVLKSHVTAGAITGALTNAQGRLELIARIFADTGVKNMFKSVYNLIQRYENNDKIIRVDNQYVEIDPASWREDLDVDVEVGIGYGDQDIRLNNLSSYTTLVEKVATQTEGIITPENIYALMREIAEEMGIKNVDKFISVPPPPEEMEPNSQEQLAQAQAQAMLMQAQATQKEAEASMQEAQVKVGRLEIERMEVEQTLALKQEELKLKGIELGYEMSSKTNVKASG